MSVSNSNVLTNVQRFISELGWETSKVSGKTVFIFWLYLNWCNDNNIRPTARKDFFVEFNKYFSNYVSSGDRYYYATCERLKSLTPEERKQARIDAILEGEERKRRKQREKKQKERRKALRAQKKSIQQN